MYLVASLVLKSATASSLVLNVLPDFTASLYRACSTLDFWRAEVCALVSRAFGVVLGALTAGAAWDLVLLELLKPLLVALGATVALPASYTENTGKFYVIVDEGGNATNIPISIYTVNNDTLNLTNYTSTPYYLNINNQAISIYNVSTGTSPGNIGNWVIF